MNMMMMTMYCIEACPIYLSWLAERIASKFSKYCNVELRNQRSMSIVVIGVNYRDTSAT